MVNINHNRMNVQNCTALNSSSMSCLLYLPSAPTFHAGDRMHLLEGRWQFRINGDDSLSNIPLPAKFGLGSDVLFEPM